MAKKKKKYSKSISPGHKVRPQTKMGSRYAELLGSIDYQNELAGKKKKKAKK